MVSAAAPLAEILAMASPTCPLFCKVTRCGALTVPAACGGKNKVLVDSTAIGGDAVPVPVNGTVCGLTWLLLTIVTPPLWIPAASGLKVTMIVQLAPGPSVDPQLLVAENGPLAAMLLMFRRALALL